jgi:rhodanese-related sulfurtransferase
MTNFVDAAFTKQHLQDRKTKVINVLSKERYAQGHLPGSINVPEDSPDFVEQVQRLIPDKSTPMIVHCSSLECQASTKAARKLESHGYKEVYDFKAGLQGWQDAGNQFETGAPGSAPQTPTLERPPRPGRERAGHHEESKKAGASELPPL